MAKSARRAITGDGICTGLTYKEDAVAHPKTKRCRDLFKEIVSEMRSRDELRGIEFTYKHITILRKARRIPTTTRWASRRGRKTPSRRQCANMPTQPWTMELCLTIKNILHRSSTAIGGRSCYLRMLFWSKVPEATAIELRQHGSPCPPTCQTAAPAPTDDGPLLAKAGTGLAKEKEMRRLQ